MSRARNLKPGFFRNADLAELPVEARLLFAGLWTLADREGRLEDRPKQIKMEIYPADSFDVDALLSELHKASFIKRYQVNGIKYIQVTNFNKHQNPHRDERVSSIPAPCEHSVNTMQEQCEAECSTIPIGLIPESLNPITDSPLPSKPKALASRLPQDWQPSELDVQFCKTTRPDLNHADIADAFRDYWIAVAGAKGRKLDWSATWRNWVRNTKSDQKTKHGAMPWWSTDQTILAKGKELGLNPRPGEVMNEFKGRINQKLAAHAA